MAVRELRRPPSMPALLARAGAGAVPGASALPFLGGGGGDMPDLTFVLRDAGVDRDRLAAYDRVCGFDLRDALPPTYPHMLAFPLHMALMTDASFPLPAIGLVHIANRITQHRSIGAAERLDIAVRCTPLHPHPRGRQFSLVTEVRSGEELVWEEVSTNLRRGGGEGEGTDGAALLDVGALPATATWRLPGDLGRRYGAVSGDLNPIHLHPLTARLFGFSSAIAHGMWTLARCLAALAPLRGRALDVEVAFRRPIMLPATVEFAQHTAGPETGFGVRDPRRDSVHLAGRMTLS